MERRIGFDRVLGLVVGSSREWVKGLFFARPPRPSLVFRLLKPLYTGHYSCLSSSVEDFVIVLSVFLIYFSCIFHVCLAKPLAVFVM